MAQAQKPGAAGAPATIERDMEATRERLAGTIDQLVYRASPKTIVKRNLAALKATYVDGTGSPRTGNILKTVGVVGGFVTVMLVIRRASK